VLKGSIQVMEFEPRQVTADAVPPEHPADSEDLLSRLRREHRTLTSCAAALAALGLHALVIAPVWGGGPFRQPQEQTHRSDTDLQWVALEDSSGHSAIIRPPSPPPLTMDAIRTTDVLPKLPTLAHYDSNRQGQSGLGAMSGRYLGQIHARIERAWLRPRIAIGAPVFQCQVRVDQDSAGRVLTITLVECNGGTPWQLSLVRAIEAASPLPAPPNPGVFAHHVLLTFRAVAYSPGTPTQLYEPPSAVVADYEPEGRDALSHDALQALADAARRHSSKVIELRIEGSKIELESDR
jgi:hypothetical protein